MVKKRHFKSKVIRILTPIVVLALAVVFGGGLKQDKADAATGTPIVITAAGDINSGSSGSTTAKATATLIRSINPNKVLALGDIAYPDGTDADFVSFEKAWGTDIKAKTIPAPGNHDYHTSGASGYYKYYGVPEYYAVDVGNGWRVYSLNCEIACNSGSSQYNWLKSDLAAHTSSHKLWFMHQPRWSSGSSHGSQSKVSDIWNLMEANGADISLSGHDHIYERFRVGQMSHWVVGTGGAGLYDCKSTREANSKFCMGNAELGSSNRGVLKLELYQDAYKYNYITTDGRTPDSGEFATRSGGTPPPPTDNPPTVSLTSPANGATLNQGIINITANANDDKAVTKVEFYVDGSLKGTDTSSPYSYAWDASLLTGSHTVQAKAYDGVNPAVSSNTATVNISNPTTCSNPTVQSSGNIAVNIPSQGTYTVWARINATDASSNAFYLKIDSGCPVVMGDATSMPTNAWTWINYKDGNTASKVTADLAAGNHNVVLMGKETNVKIDKVLLLAGSCTPTSASANECIDSTAPAVSITSPTAGQQVSGNVSINANATDASGVAKVSFYVDNGTSPISEDTSSPYTAIWDSKTVANGAHTIKATATDSVGNASAAVTVSVNVNNSDQTAPSDPTNLQVTKSLYNEVDLSWSPSGDNVGVAGYNIYRNGNTAVFTTVTGTSFKDTQVTPNTNYTYQVEAYDAAGNKSAKVSVSTLTPSGPDQEAPTAPTNLTAKAVIPAGGSVATSVSLSWTKSTDNVGVTNYLIRRNNVVIASVTGTTYNDNNINVDTTYSYVVIAQDAAGNNSVDSNIATVKTPPPPPNDNSPSKPANLTASALNSSQVNLKWDASTDDYGVVGYRIYRNGGSTPIATVTTTTFGDSTVSPGQTYSYQVSAYDVTQEGQKSNSVSVTVPQENNSTDFSDNFTGGSSQWSVVSGSWSVASDGNQGNVYKQTQNGDAWSTAGSSQWGDYSVEAKIKPLEFISSGSSSQFAGLYGRWQDQTHWYYVTLRNTGVIELKKNDGNKYTVLDSKNIGVTAGTWYNVKLEMVGTNLKVYLNGQETLSASDSTISSGKIGLGSYYSAAEYDDVKVTGSSKPQLLVFASTDDAYIEQKYPDKNYGNGTEFLIDKSPQRNGLLKFTVSGVNGRMVTGATLLLYGKGNSNFGGYFDPALSNWDESSVTWNSAPAALSAFRLGSLGAVTKGNFYTVDVRNFIRADGTYTIRISSNSDDTMSYATREDVSKSNTVSPKLILNVQN